MLFNLMKIDTKEVLEAAGTKWNFLSFNPGLVGGHCIGVDPYYLTYKAKELGYKSKIILSGRELNDSMSEYVCTRIEKKSELGTKLKKFLYHKGPVILNIKTEPSPSPLTQHILDTKEY